MTRRDRMVLGVLGAVVALAAFWFVALGPKRHRASDLGSQVAEQQKRLDTARATLTAGQQARTAYPFNYATVARLGKAVPADDDVPSLVYQLSTTSNRTNVDFRSLQLESGSGSTTPAPPPPATGSGSSGSSGSGSTGSGSTGSGSGSTAPGGQAATGSGSSPGASTGSSTTAPAAGASTTAPAAQSATATLPPGAVVGEAGFATMPFSFTFQGSFFRLADFFNRLERYIVPRHDDVDVTGRLLMIDGISLTAGSNGFPSMKASVSATTYLLPSDQGLLAGATPTSPGAPSTGQSVSTPTPAPPTAPAAATTLK